MATAELASTPKHTLFLSILAGVAAGVYYIQMKSAFSMSIRDVVANPFDVDPFANGLPKWGSHWIYRLLAEAVSLAFGTLIAAFVRRDNPIRGALIGGGTISVGYIAFLSWAFYVLQQDPSVRLIEPWVQQAIDAIVIVGAPLAGLVVGNSVAAEISEPNSAFQRTSRYHLLWLWLPAYWYAAILIPPLTKFFTRTDDSIITTIVIGVPVYAAAIPLFMGLALLSGETGGKTPKWLLSLYGAGCLVAGAIAAAILQYFWTKLVLYLVRTFWGGA